MNVDKVFWFVVNAVEFSRSNNAKISVIGMMKAMELAFENEVLLIIDHTFYVITYRSQMI